MRRETSSPFRGGNLRLERRRAEIRIHANHVRAEFGHDGLGVVDQRFVVVEGDNAHLIRREPEREVARVMLDEETDEAFMRSERRAKSRTGQARMLICPQSESGMPSTGQTPSHATE